MKLKLYSFKFPETARVSLDLIVGAWTEKEAQEAYSRRITRTSVLLDLIRQEEARLIEEYEKGDRLLQRAKRRSKKKQEKQTPA
jgi:hypothetical protein